MKKNIMKDLLFSASVCAFIVAMSACNKDTYEKTGTGLEYKFIEGNGEGAKPKVDDMIMLHMIATSDNDTELVNSAMMTNGAPMAIKMFPPAFQGSIEEAFMMMSKGDSASFLISADSFYNKLSRAPMPSFVKPGSKLRFNIRMVDILSQKEYTRREQQKEQAALEQLKVANPGKFSEGPEGLLYETIKANPTGRVPKDGDTVAVHYTGTLIDGTKFDSSLDYGEPFELVMGQHSVIPGWEEMLKLMHEGEKVKAVIPSPMAYGVRGNRGIPPFSTLIFEMELVKIK